jgi:LysM repeat protein
MRNRLLKASLLIAILVLNTVAVQAAPPRSDPIVHIVQWGETLSMIANHYGTTVESIVQANNLRNANYIYTGQRLVIPSGAGTWSGGTYYTVKRGDNLTLIAARFGTTVSAIVQANNLQNPSFIYKGQELFIPGAVVPPVSGTGVYYTVSPGDTLMGITYRFGVNYWDIVQANNIANPSHIYVGQRLFIPGAVAPTTTLPVCTPTPAAVVCVTATPTPVVCTPTPTPVVCTPTAAVVCVTPTPAVVCVTPTPAVVCVTATPVGTPPPPCRDLIYPRNNTVVKGEIEIRGTAEVQNFWYYKVEFRFDDEPNQWRYIYSAYAPVHDGVLAVWDTSPLPDGVYWLKLSVVDRTGNYRPGCEARITVTH